MTKKIAFCPGTGRVDPFSALYPGDPVNLYSTGLEGLQGVDALVLWGGEDISPSLYGQKVGHGHFRAHATNQPSTRDILEWEAMKEAYRLNIPIIGVCRGAQIATAFAGGSLVHHVNGHEHGNHDVITNKGVTFSTNSIHHQMMNPYDLDEKVYQLLAWSSKPQSSVYYGTEKSDIETKQGMFSTLREPEMVYYSDIKAFCVQGHPEWMAKDTAMVQYCLEQIETLLM